MEILKLLESPTTNMAIGKATFATGDIPDDIQTIIIIGTQGVGPKETGLASLESCILRLNAQNKQAQKPGATVSPFSSGYALADFTATRDDVGAVASIILAKLTKRSPEAPWEFVPIGSGAAELTVDEMIWQGKTARDRSASTQQQTLGLDSYLHKFWRPIPTGLRVYVLNAISLPADKAGSCNPFVQFVPILKMNYEVFEKSKTATLKNTINPVWNESFEFKKVANHSRKDLSVLGTVWDQSSVSPVFLGEFKVPLKKWFLEASKHSLKSGEANVKLEKSSSKSFKTTRSVSGELKIRFICF